MNKIVPILIFGLIGGCAQYPTRDMQPNEVLVLIKPVRENVQIRSGLVSMRHELSFIGNHGTYFRKKSRAQTAKHLPAGTLHYSSYCRINDEQAGSEDLRTIFKPGSCYAPHALGARSESVENQAIYHAQIISGRPYRPYELTNCVIELKEVDCGWLKQEMKSAAVGYKTPPLWINTSR